MDDVNYVIHEQKWLYGPEKCSGAFAKRARKHLFYSNGTADEWSIRCHKVFETRDRLVIVTRIFYLLIRLTVSS